MADLRENATHHSLMDKVIINQLNEDFIVIREALISDAEVTRKSRCRDSLHIVIHVQGLEFFALLDTGAQVSICHKRFIELLEANGHKYELHPTDIRVSGVERSEVRVLGRVNVDIEIAGEKATIKLYVCDNVSTMIIIGLDFWDAEEIELRCGENKAKEIYFRKHRVKRVSNVSKPVPGEVRVCEMTIINPGREALLKCYIVDPPKTGTEISIVMTHEFPGVWTRDLISTSEEGICRVIVNNFSKHPLILPQDKIIGHMELCPDEAYEIVDARFLEEVPLNEDFEDLQFQQCVARVNEIQFNSDVDCTEEISLGNETLSNRHDNCLGPASGAVPASSHVHDKTGPCAEMPEAVAAMFNRAVDQLNLARSKRPSITDKDVSHFKDKLETILRENCKVFSLHDYDIGSVRPSDYQVSLQISGIGDPIKGYPIRHNPQHQEIIKEAVKNMMKHDIIEKNPKVSDYNLSLLVVKRKSTPEEVKRPDYKPKFRVVVDARELNKRLVTPTLAIDTIDEMVAKLSGRKYYFSLDLKLAFWAIPIHKDSRQYVSFTFQGQGYCFKRLVMGAVDSPYHLVNFLHRIFENEQEINKRLMIYFDDISSGSNSIDGLLNSLSNVLAILRKHRMKASPQKCDLFAIQIKFLGWILDHEGRHADPKKIELVCNALPPKDKKALASWIGMVSWIREVGGPDLAAFMRPLHTLSTTRVNYKWEEIHDECFQQIKKCLSSNRVLAPFIRGAPKSLYCDSSGHHAGATLVQTDKNNKKSIVTYFTKCVPAQYINWCPVQLELWAIFAAVRSLMQYLVGEKVIIYTDNHPAYFILTTKRSVLKAQYWRWISEIAALDHEVVYIPGKTNWPGDLPSRANHPETCKQCKRGLTAEGQEEYKKLCDVNCLVQKDFICQLVREPPTFGVWELKEINETPQRTIDQETTQEGLLQQISTIMTRSKRVEAEIQQQIEAKEAQEQEMPLIERQEPNVRQRTPGFPTSYHNKRGKERIQELDNANRDAEGNAMQRLPGAPPQHDIPKVETKALREFLQSEQRDDADLSEIWRLIDESIEKPPFDRISHLSQTVKYYYGLWPAIIIKDGVLHLREYTENLHRYYDRPFLPRSLAEALLRINHDKSGHCGIPQTSEKMRRSVFYAELEYDVFFYVRSCEQCRQRETPSTARDITHTFSPGHAGEIIGMDCRVLTNATSKKYTRILTIMDFFSKYVNMTLLEDETTETIYSTLVTRWFNYFGPPQQLIVDRLRANISQIAQMVADQYHFHLQASTSHHSKGLSLVERSHRTSSDILAKLMKEQQIDQELVDLSALAMNNMIDHDTGMTPMDKMMARDASEPLQRMLDYPTPDIGDTSKSDYVYEHEKRLLRLRRIVTDDLQRKILRRKEAANMRAVFNRFHENQYCWCRQRGTKISTGKFAKFWELGRVVRRITDYQYIVKLRNAKHAKRMNVTGLRRCYTPVVEQIRISNRDRRMVLDAIPSHEDSFYDEDSTPSNDKIQEFRTSDEHPEGARVLRPGETAPEAEDPPKRKRGRPPKNKTVPEAIPAPESNEVASVEPESPETVPEALMASEAEVLQDAAADACASDENATSETEEDVGEVKSTPQ